MQNQNESLLDIILLLFKWWKQIIGASFLAAVITAGISLMLPNYYEASTQFYAASPDLAQPSPLGNMPESKRIYGNDNDIDRLISISKSNTVSNYLIDSFDLYNHYEIKEDDPKGKYKLLLKLEKHFEITKTKYDAIKLSFEDKVPETAAAMANATRNKVDELARTMIKSSQENLLNAYKRNVTNKQLQYDAISDSLYYTRNKYNIFNTQSQGEAFGSSMVSLEGKIQSYKARISYLQKKTDVPQDSINIFKAKLEGFKTQYKNLGRNISEYNNGYPKILNFERQLKDFGDQLNIDKERLKQLQAVYNSEISAIHIVEKAETPVIKSRPKRSFLVIGIAALTFVLMSIWVIAQDQLNKSDWRKKISEA
ncbi:MAG: hypothetical protein HKO66_03735 [Saprospiraceae bacterium]|nr:hypothetical protein [Bacteroidia bacterium]NNE14379.1 hypothetical protein [Saprospiraceae bacterium]NNL91324.1 hypothetical protein [Saprospiraceae bacterium]